MDKKLMKLFIDCPNYIREIVLNDYQLEIVRAIRDRGTMTARQLAARKDITIQSASTQLATLYRRKYLKRKGFNSESGGIEYEYESVV